tara:strand:- start:15218 stop:17275 length:2058 start_codon:yes stop_codon:yes gene_type:complete
MAIEKVGGTYVITGSQVKPGVTSTGQSWANLVTQQKYQLWKIANAEAARRIKFEQLNAQRQQQVVDQMRQSLLNQQNDTRAQIENLKQLQIEDLAKQQATLAQEQNLRGRAQRRTTSAGVGGGSGMKVDLIDTESKLRRQADFAERQVEDAFEAAKNAGADVTVLQKWKAGQGGRTSKIEAEIIDKLDAGGRSQFEAFKDSIIRSENARDNYNEFVGANLEGRFDYVEKRQRGANRGFGAGGSRTYYTKEDPIVAAPLADREPAIQRLEKRLRDLERQQLNLTDVDIPVGDEIRTTRQILGSKFGYGSQRLPEQPAPAPAPAPVQKQEPQVQQNLSRVRPVDREILDLVAEEEPLTQTARQPSVAPTVPRSEQTVVSEEEPVIDLGDFVYSSSDVDEGEEDPGISITDLAAMAYGNQPTVLQKAMDKYTQPMGTAQRYASEPVTDLGDFVYSASEGEDFEFQPSRPEVVDPFQFQPSTPEVVDPFQFQPSTPTLQSQQDINRSVLQQMRQAEQETLQNIVQEAMPKPSPFRDVKQVMDQASKILNNADLQIAGLQMLKDYAYLQQTDPEEYFKIKDVVQSTVAKRLNLKEYQIQQAAKQLTKVNEVTPQKLANTVKGATASDAELVIQLTGALFNDVNSIESAYENARQQINTYADKGGLLEDQRIKMLTLLENYKAYKTLVVER